MSRITQQLEQTRADGRTALIPLLTVGWPDPDGFVRLAREVAQYSDVIGLRMPFGDSLSHSHPVERSFREARQAGFNVEGALSLVAQFRDETDCPLFIETPYSVLKSNGVTERCRAFVESGVDGLTVVDLPVEEAGELEAADAASLLDLIFCCTPNTSPERIERICQHTQGFVLCADSAANEQDKPEPLAKFLDEVRQHTTLPVGLALNIQSIDRARRVARAADALVLGSGLLKAVREALGAVRVAAAARFLAEMREALDR